MAKQIKSFYKRFFLGLLLVPVLKLVGLGMEANAADCPNKANAECTAGDTRYVTTGCASGQLKKQVCGSCTYEYQSGCCDVACSCKVYSTAIGTGWTDSGGCTTYTSNCSYAGQTSTQSCTNVVGTGTQTRTCEKLTAGSSTYYMWGAYGGCTNYTSCAVSTDVLDAGKCYCVTSCDLSAVNGYGSMIAEVRYSAVCPQVSSSSSV